MASRNTHGHSFSPHAGKMPQLHKNMQVYFFRDFRGFSGGHLKVWHYFNYVKDTAGYDAAIAFSADSLWDRTNPWLSMRQETLGTYDYRSADCLFVAGEDWRALPEAARRNPSVPVINLVQGIRHADPKLPLYGYLAYPAIRITVSQEISNAISATGKVTGPVFTIPCGISLDELPHPLPWNDRRIDVVVCALKNPDLGSAIAGILQGQGHRVDLLLGMIPRPEYLSRVRSAKVAVMIPAPAEGFYLPTVEAMALDVLAVCPDCGGNRSHCKNGETAEVPEWKVEAFIEAAGRLLGMDVTAREGRLERAKAAIERFSSKKERESFQAILRQLPELWRSLR